MLLDTISSHELLIDAYKFYSRGDARAHDALSIIVDRDDMRGAVIGCLEKATTESDVQQQKLCCNAACFGKQYYPGIAIEEYQTVCRQLRTQYVCKQYITEASLDPIHNIDLLLEKKHYSLALWVAQWNKCSSETVAKILTQWCEYVIKKKHERDEPLAIKIIEKLGSNPAVSYADIAKIAIQHQRIRLAIKLIENEHQAAKKIPLLISIEEYDLVLAQAVATCDSNSIYSSIFKLRDLIGNEMRFLQLIKKNRQPYRYYCNFVALVDIKKLINIQYSDGGKEDVLLYLLDNNLESALGVSKRLKQDFVASQIDSQMRLRKFFQQNQKQFDAKPPPLASQENKDWTDLSISDTIINLIAVGLVAKAKECQRKFEVSDRKYKVLEQIALESLPKLELPTSGS